jgi:hypothetical protein
MRTLIAILANGVIYGTDVFGAIVLRPAIAAASGHWVSTVAGALATLALMIFIGVYNRVCKPVNTALTAAALSYPIDYDEQKESCNDNSRRL